MRQVVEQLERVHDPRLIVGTETADDAGVVRLDARRALVQTVDFITPIVDDPKAFGGIAAANSLSDVYAMGGEPLTALNVVCFPVKKLPLSVLGEVLQGGLDKCREAGCLLVGGHTVDDPEFKYGLSVTGLVDPERVVRNSTARPGDVLVLTKPLGSGILSAAARKGKLGDPERVRMTEVLLELNAAAGRAMVACGASAGTDVTGFGVLGHGFEMAAGARVRVVLEAGHLPLLPGARGFAGKGLVTAADRRNREYLGRAFRRGPGVADDLTAIAFDAQTSGGLLVALPETGVDGFLRAVRGAVVVGRVEAGATEVALL